jgi:DNA-binding NtrC family response regulator
MRGHDPDVANNATVAMQLLNERDYDLVLCDLMMPELSGMEIYARTLACKPALAHRFVFITGGAFTDRAREFIAEVPNQVIEKPFDLATIRSIVAGAGAAAGRRSEDGYSQGLSSSSSG